MTTDVALQTDALDDGVVEDLPGLWAVTADSLRSRGCLIVHAALDGKRLGVEFDGHLETLLELVAHTTAPIAYVKLSHWTTQLAAGYRQELADDEDLAPTDVAAVNQSLDRSDAHLGELAAVTISILVNGVVHTFYFCAGWYNTSASERAQTLAQGREASAVRWDRSFEREEQERAKIYVKLADLADALVTDEPFLILTNERARRGRADQLASPLVGPNLMGDQKIRSAILNAVQTATDRRNGEVVPVRTAALRERLPQLAEALRSDPDFASATTKQARERCARDLLTLTDPVALSAPLIVPLVTGALAGGSPDQPALATL